MTLGFCSRNILIACFLSLYSLSYANTTLQQQLLSIASQEAQIAGIGANKINMLYGVANPIPIIEKWNLVQNKPALTELQIKQINELEHQKHILLKRGEN